MRLHDKEEIRSIVKAIGYFSSIGISMALAIVLGALIGRWIDKTFNTDPWGFFIFICFGITAAFRNLYIMSKKAREWDKKL